MTNNAQLLPLPALDDELYDKFNGMSAQWHEAMIHRYAQSYALACIEAAKPADALWSLPVVAEGLAEALADVMSWISNWTPDFIYDPEWPDSRERAVLALATYESAQGDKK